MATIYHLSKPTLHDYPQSLKDKWRQFNASLSMEGRPLAFVSRTLEALDLTETRLGRAKKTFTVKTPLNINELYQRIINALGEDIGSKIPDLAPAMQYIDKKIRMSAPSESIFKMTPECY